MHLQARDTPRCGTPTEPPSALRPATLFRSPRLKTALRYISTVKSAYFLSQVNVFRSRVPSKVW